MFKFIPNKFNFSTTQILILFFVSILIIHYLALILFSSAITWNTDYKYLYFSTKQLLHQKNLYAPNNFFSTTINSTTNTANLNPPFVAILMMPFGLMNYSTSFISWSILSLILSVISIALILKKLFSFKNHFSLYLISTLLVCTYFPTFANIKSGQIGALLFFLVTLGWLFFRESKTQLAGFFWGIAFSIKLFVGLFLILLITQKKWGALKTFLITTTVCILIGLLIFTPETYFNYTLGFKAIEWYSSSWNASLLGFFSRLFGYQNEQNVSLIHCSTLTPIFYLLSSAFLLVSFLFFKKDDRLTTDLAISYTLIAMLLISPLGWMYYFSLLFIPFAIIFYWNQQLFHSLWINIFLSLAVFCSSAPYLLLKPGQITSPINIFLHSDIYFFALCLLTLLIFYLNWQRTGNANLMQHKSIKMEYLTITLFSTAILPSFLGILQITHLIFTSKL